MYKKIKLVNTANICSNTGMYVVYFALYILKRQKL